MLIAFIAVTGFTSVQAQDRYFAITYSSNVLPKGAVDMEILHASRFGHQGEFYNAQDQRMEIVIGLGKNV